MRAVRWGIGILGEVLVTVGAVLLLFVVTLGLNVIALHVVRRYREQYD